MTFNVYKTLIELKNKNALTGNFSQRIKNHLCTCVSNPGHSLRRAISYPLDYEGIEATVFPKFIKLYRIYYVFHVNKQITGEKNARYEL